MKNACSILLLTATAAAFGQELTIRNETLQVRFEGGAFSIAARNRTFAHSGVLRRRGGTAKVTGVSDPTFGQAQAIEIEYEAGDTDRILIFPALPFVLFRSVLRNSSGEGSITGSIRPLGFDIDFGVAPAGLNTLGTGGLSPSTNPAGTYSWLAIAEPRTRNGVVGGWITSERGSGVLFSQARGSRVHVDPQIDYGKLRLKPGQSETLETFALGYFDDARLGLEAWADAVARVHRVKLKPQPDGYCTWYHARASTEKDLPRQAALAAQQLKPYGFSFVQIDDGWQDGIKTNGPKKNFTRVQADGPYPSGMKLAADAIRAQGLTPGIWFMPFAGNYQDPWFKDRQHWFAKREDGSPYEVHWGGTSFDMTHPEVRDYVRTMVQRIVKDWGFTYLKMDGLWTGSATEMQYVNDAYKDDHIGNAVLHDPNKTNVEMYRDALKLVREAAGPEPFFLGCNTPQNMRVYSGSFGLVDAMRIGPDNGIAWESLIRGPRYGSRNYHLNGRVWWNDPDPLYVRAALPLNQARLISAWVSISGQLNVSSEDYASLPPDRLDLLKRTLPSHGRAAKPVDLFENDIPRLWRVGNLVGAFNWDMSDRAIDYPLDQMDFAAGQEYAAFEYWTDSLLPPVRNRLKLTLPAATSAVIALRPLADHPQLISTSRHITQGLVDVIAENWSGTELKGTSRLVGGDPYQLRVLRSSTRGDWKFLRATAPPDVEVSTKEDGKLVRVTLKSARGGDIPWTLTFER